jgi:hypothetical protein
MEFYMPLRMRMRARRMRIATETWAGMWSDVMARERHYFAESPVSILRSNRRIAVRRSSKKP